MKKVLLVIFGLAIVLIIAYFSLVTLPFYAQGTNVAFQSSDGKWADNEVLFKGRGFESIVFCYELYKIKCNVVDVELQRITKKPGFLSIRWWFDDFDHPKWKIPLADHHQNLEGKFYVDPPCKTRGTSQKEIDQANENSKLFLQKLKNP